MDDLEYARMMVHVPEFLVTLGYPHDHAFTVVDQNGEPLCGRFVEGQEPVLIERKQP